MYIYKRKQHKVPTGHRIRSGHKSITLLMSYTDYKFITNLHYTNITTTTTTTTQDS